MGVAITVPDPWGEDLQERRAAFGDTLAWTIPTHITLLAPMHVPVARIARVDDHLSAVAAVTPAFSALLKGSGSFRPVTQTSFVVVREGAQKCEWLAEKVRSGPLRRSLTYPYHPHVTIAVDLPDQAHDRAESEMSTFCLELPVTQIERFELAEHGVWESVATFPLLGRDG